MKLLTKKLRERLLTNGARRPEDPRPHLEAVQSVRGRDLAVHGARRRRRHIVGLADLGFATPELGYSSLAEISAIRVRFGLGIERDLHFRARFPLSIYTQAARAAGHIVEHGPELEAAAERHHTTPRLTAFPSPSTPRPGVPGRGVVSSAPGDRHARPPDRNTRRRPAAGHAPDGPREKREHFAQIRGHPRLGNRAPTDDRARDHRHRRTGESVLAATDADPYFNAHLGSWSDLEFNLRGWGAACGADPAVINGLVDRVRRASR